MYVSHSVHTRLEEIARKLKTGDVLPAVERERYVLQSN